MIATKSMVELAEISIGVCMQMPQKEEIKAVLSKEAISFLNNYAAKYDLKSISESLEAAITNLQKFEEMKLEAQEEAERWRKSIELAANDEDVNRNLWETDDDVRGLYDEVELDKMLFRKQYKNALIADRLKSGGKIDDDFLKEADKKIEIQLNRFYNEELWKKGIEESANDEDVNRNLWETDDDVRGLY